METNSNKTNYTPPLGRGKGWAFTTTSKTILADLYTPVGVYLRLRDLYPQSVLMESSDYHEKDNSRSFIGIDPLARGTTNGLQTSVKPSVMPFCFIHCRSFFTPSGSTFSFTQ